MSTMFTNDDPIVIYFFKKHIDKLCVVTKKGLIIFIFQLLLSEDFHIAITARNIINDRFKSVIFCKRIEKPVYFNEVSNKICVTSILKKKHIYTID